MLDLLVKAQSLFLTKHLLILLLYFISYFVKNSIQLKMKRRGEKLEGAEREKLPSLTK